MNTQDIMQVALDLAGMAEVPGDSAVFVPGKGIRRALIGIDIGVAELLAAKQLGFDVVIAHHPPGAPAGFADVLRNHARLLEEAGVPRDVAERAVARMVEAHGYRHHVANHDHVPSFARLLGVPFLNVHQPCDEVGRRVLAETIARRVRPDDPVSAVIDALMTLPELQDAPTRPEVRVGSPQNRTGRVLVGHGAGTNGGYEVARAAFDHGVGTALYIHVDVAVARQLAAEGGGNLVVSGHIASDMVGINPFITALEERGVHVTRASGCHLGQRR